jgi:hypothetical protein
MNTKHSYNIALIIGELTSIYIYEVACISFSLPFPDHTSQRMDYF